MVIVGGGSSVFVSVGCVASWAVPHRNGSFLAGQRAAPSELVLGVELTLPLGIHCLLYWSQ